MKIFEIGELLVRQRFLTR